MKPEDKSKRQTTRGRRTHKTKDDFLRWLRKQSALKKEQNVPLKPPTRPRKR
jgi:hypothetical protein